MLSLILFLIIVWIVVGIVGFVVHGLFWLFIIAVVLGIVTLVFGGTRLGKSRRS